MLVFRREVTLDSMDDLFSGAIAISWRKLAAFVEEDRRTWPTAAGAADRR